MAGRGNVYKSQKRQKELIRKKKQEEKRLKRLSGGKSEEQDAGQTVQEGEEPSPSPEEPAQPKGE